MKENKKMFMEVFVNISVLCRKLAGSRVMDLPCVVGSSRHFGPQHQRSCSCEQNKDKGRLTGFRNLNPKRADISKHKN